MKSEKGFTLIEVLIALALLGMIATAFLMAISTASKAIMIADERTIAESLARSQMEYVKEQDYIYDDDEAVYLPIGTGEYPDSFSICSKDRDDETVGDIIGVPWDSEDNVASLTDYGLQKIELVIKNNDKEVLTLEGYKVDEGVY